MDGDDAPGALDTELLEEGYCCDLFGTDECVGVEEAAADDANEDYGEAAPEDLGAVPYGRAACHSPKISNNLSDCDGVWGEAVLILEHGGVEILRAMGHEIEAGHQKDKVTQ